MRSTILVLTLVPLLAVAAPKKSRVRTQTVSGTVAAKQFLRMVAAGEHEGTVPGKKSRCAVSISNKDNYFTVEVDDVTVSIGLKVDCEMRDSKNSIALVDVEEDGDESVGSYTFTRTARATKLRNGLLKVSAVEEKEYTDVDYETETRVAACVIEP